MIFGHWLPGPDENANYVLPIPLKTTPEPPIRMRKRDRDRAERVRLAGGPPPTLRERAVAHGRKKGEVRTKDLTGIGIPRCYLARMCDEGLLVKIGYGATGQRTTRRHRSVRDPQGDHFATNAAAR